MNLYLVQHARAKQKEEDPERPLTEKGQADIIIAKHRNGEIGDLSLTFRGQFSRFENYVPEFELPHDGGFS